MNRFTRGCEWQASATNEGAIARPRQAMAQPLAGAHMKLVAVSVGKPKEVLWRGRSVQTSIFKTSVSGPVHVTRFNIVGDEQSDLSVTAGAEKAVKDSPAEHYAFWRRDRPDPNWPGAHLGKNSTTE